MPTPVLRRSGALAAASVLVAVLTACTAPSPEPQPTSASSAPAPTPSATASDAPPALQPDGDAAANLPHFAGVVQSVWAGAERGAGRAYIDALTAAGFDKAAMEVTEDFSTVGNAAESLQFSVRWGEECLVGQVGEATGEPVATTVPVLAAGTCLIGTTRAIDW